MPGLTALLVTAFTLAFAATLQAQVLSDPRVAEFDASPDHWAFAENGEPAVLRYELHFFTIGASSPFGTVDMGKPDPDADGKIRYDFSTQLSAWSLPGGDYEARVSAIGPAGSAFSDPSNPFTFGPASGCTLSLSAATVSAPAAGGNNTVDVFTDAGCEWAVTNAPSWVTLGTAGGSGTGRLAFAVQPNTSSSVRRGTIAIGDQLLTISQDAGAAPATRTTPTITWTTPTAITQGTPLGSTQLNAKASVPGAFAYSPSAGTVLAAGTHTLTANFTPADATAYTTATRSVTLQVTSTGMFKGPASGGGWSGRISGSTLLYNGQTYPIVNGRVSFPDCTTYIVAPDGALLGGSATPNCTLGGSGTRTAPTLTWPTPAPVAAGTALSAAQLNATASVAGTYV